MNAMFHPEVSKFPLPEIMDVLSGMPEDRPRIIKTHLSWDMMPDEFWQKKSKVRIP